MPGGPRPCSLCGVVRQRQRSLSTAMIVRVGAGKRASVTARIYLFHVRLAEIDPPIWRRIAVPWTRTHHDLHGMLQAAMGWQDYHHYQFEIGETRYKDPDPEDRDPVGPDPRGRSLSMTWPWSKERSSSTPTTSGTARNACTAGYSVRPPGAGPGGCGAACDSRRAHSSVAP